MTLSKLITRLSPRRAETSDCEPSRAMGEWVPNGVAFEVPDNGAWPPQQLARTAVPSTIFSRGGDSPIPSHTVTHANPFPQRNLITNQPTCQLSHHRCTDVLGELGAALILLFDALLLSVLGLFVIVLRIPTVGYTGK